jgi:hypothetical protein
MGSEKFKECNGAEMIMKKETKRYRVIPYR